VRTLIVLLMLFGISTTALPQEALNTKRAPSAKSFSLKTPKAEESKAKISGLAVANCSVKEDCSWSRTFQVGKAPFKFGVEITSKPEAKGVDVDYLVQLKEFASNKVVFEAYWSSKIEFEGQLDVAGYDALPPALQALKPGRYKLFVSVVSADSSIFDEKEIPLIAQGTSIVKDKNQVSAGAWGTCITLSGGDDGNPGFLACAASVVGPTNRNNTTDGAFSNLSACLSSKTDATIMGHGNSGLICTGNGNHCGGTADDNISSSNGAKWITLANKIKGKATSLKLAGCDVGEGQAGSDLLAKMAKAVNATVSAPTGLLWCNAAQKRMWIDGTWATASPTMAPKIVKTSSPAKKIDMQAQVIIPVEGKKVTVQRKDLVVENVSFSAVGTPKSFRALPDFLLHVDFESPLETDSVPAARVTGKLVVSVKGKNIKKNYNILSNKLIQDVDEPTYYYRLDSVIQDRLSAIDK